MLFSLPVVDQGEGVWVGVDGQGTLVRAASGVDAKRFGNVVRGAIEIANHAE
jgi:hypothetical protein